MFFKIKNLSVDSLDKQIALGNILDACREGRHFIWIPKSEIKALLDQGEKFSFLSSHHQDIFGKLHHDVGDDGHQYLKDLTVFVEINFSDELIDELNTKKIIKNYKYFLNSDALRETALLVENLDDGRFYHELGEIYKERYYSQHDKVVLKNKPMLGGGSTTYTVFKQECTSLQPLFCILDSDQKHPGQTTHGDTATKVLDEKDKVKHKIIDVHVLHVRAIENLVPLNILRVISDEGKVFGLVFEENNKEYLKYIKCKDQHKSKKYENDVYKKYRQNEYINLEEIKEVYCADSQIGAFWQKFYDTHKDSENDIVCANLHANMAWHGKFLENCLFVLQTCRNIRKDLIEDHDGEWNKIAAKIFSWSFSYNILK